MAVPLIPLLCPGKPTVARLCGEWQSGPSRLAAPSPDVGVGDSGGMFDHSQFLEQASDNLTTGAPTQDLQQPLLHQKWLHLHHYHHDFPQDPRISHPGGPVSRH